MGLRPATCVCSFVSFSLIFLVPSNVHHELARLRRQTTGGFWFCQPRRNYWKRWSLWAKSANFNVSPAELSTFASNYNSPEHFQASGITLAGVRYIFLSGTDRVLRAKKNKSGLHCMKTEKGIILSIYEEPTTPQQAANVVEKLGDYLISHGY